ncbi:hypothetical protein L209DRAFT_758268 [Thermothelomyces heterothallicus CBS 203.75]
MCVQQNVWGTEACMLLLCIVQDGLCANGAALPTACPTASNGPPPLSNANSFIPRRSVRDPRPPRAIRQPATSILARGI